MNFHSLMRLANYLTIARILLIPFFMLSFRYERMLPALVIFCVAAFTDYIDGVIARRQGTTSFGKFMDPLADKLLVGAALICLTRFKGGLIPGWMVLIIMGREVVITTLRLVFVGRYGTVVAASRWGKYKTSSQMIVIIISLVLLVSHEYSQLLNIAVDFFIQARGTDLLHDVHSLGAHSHFRIGIPIQQPQGALRIDEIPGHLHR